MLERMLVEGVVVDTSDPQEMGRMKVWCPSIDGPDYNIETLPWVMYVTPMAGQASDMPAGGTSGESSGPVSYGLWSVPKVGANVVIGFLYGDHNQRIYMGSFFRTHANRSLPAGRNSAAGPTSDTLQPIEPTASNLKAQFQNNLSDSIARTRGVYERQAAQAADVKTDEEGYSKRGDSPYGAGELDPQTYCWTTPGRNVVLMQDDPRFARIRIRTASGEQIILDDANERIYVSTAHGKSWLELDRDGHVHVYAAASVSVSAGGDFNIQALGSVNISAGKDLNLAAGGNGRLSACGDVSLSGDGGLNLTSGATMNILAAGQLLQTGSEIHLNGPAAAEAPCATGPTITPSHEPWTRPASSVNRGPNWKA